MGTLFEDARSLISFPGRCRICGALLRYSSREYPGIPVCPGCLAAPGRLITPLCRICGRSLVSEIGTCSLCRERSYPFSEHRSLYEYRGVAKGLIGLYKFSQVRSLSRFFADRLAEVIGRSEEWEGVVVVPVPGNPTSVRRRGWDQVRLIAKHLARSYGFPVEDVLRRRRSKTQKSLGFVSRSRNLTGKIRIKSGRRTSGIPRDIVLLDDVFTTGSTAAECTRVLLHAGARRVRVLTLAID